MIDGRDAWNQWFQKDMGDMKLDSRLVYTFPHMKNSFYEMLRETAAKYPNKPGLCDNWNRIYTYREFLYMVDVFAAYLKEMLHVQKGRHVGLLLNNGIEFAVSFYAICRLGAVAVPFPTKYREAEVSAMVSKADLHCILVSEDYGQWTASYEDAGVIVLRTRGEEEGYGFTYLNLESCIGELTETECKNETGTGKPQDEVILMFTSGTTSASKGVVLKNYNINHAVMTYQRLLQLGPEDSTVIPVPIYHITGLVALLGLFVYMGGTVYLYKRFDARRILESITAHEITFLHGSPTVFRMLLDYREEFQRLPGIRKIACGSSYMPVETIKKLHSWMPQMMFHNVYGMTETSSPATVFPNDAALSIYPGSSGKPIPGLSVRILDEDGREVSPGTVGTIFLKGAVICEYYYQLETTLLTEDGWLNTGDMGYINEDSYVFIVDRKKDMINRGGEKIWCTDVEEALLSINGIKDAAVVGIPDEKYGEAAAAVVVRVNGDFISEERIRENLMGKLARFKIPEKILFLDSIPKTAGLKTDKKYIRTLFL